MRCQDQAKAILNAWSHGDRTRVGQLLESRSRRAGAGRQSSFEQEREELLEGIRAGLRSGQNGQDAPVTAVSIRLLRHLATAHN
jgi:hypothetical protein